MTDVRKRQRSGARGIARLRSRVLIAGSQTQDAYALVEAVVRRGQEPPLHAHTREDEMVYVVAGRVTFYIDGAPIRLSPGESVVLPKGSEHTYRVDTGRAKFLVLLMPAGLESYYKELGEGFDGQENVELLISLSARYGIGILGPHPAVPMSTQAEGDR